MLGIYLGYEFLTDIIFNPASKFIFGSEFTAAHIFTVVEFSIFISIFFYLMKRKYKKTIVAISTFIFLSAVIFENLIIKNIGFDSLSVGTSYIILIFCSVISIGDTIKYNSSKDYFINTNFLILSAIIIYFSGTLFIYVLSNSFYSNYNFNKFYYLINPTIITLRNILLFAALLILYQDNKKQKLIVA